MILHLQRCSAKTSASKSEISGMIVHLKAACLERNLTDVRWQIAASPDFQTVAGWRDLDVSVGKTFNQTTECGVQIAPRVQRVVQVDADQSVLFEERER